MDEVSCQNWIDVDLNVLAENARIIREYLSEDCRLLAVVKSDAYGHGAPPVARTLLDNGADYLGVATLAEAMELRRYGLPNAPILVFAPLEAASAPVFVEQGLTATITEVTAAEALSEAAESTGVTSRAHIKVDTGMSRYGLFPRDVENFAAQVFELPGIEWEGIYSHFANGYSGNTAMCTRQFSRFMSVINELADSGFEVPLRHIANSPTALDSSKYHLDMVRIGNALYGLGGVTVGRGEDEKRLSDSWSFNARITDVREIPAGTPVGYGGEFVSCRPMRVAVVAVGLSHGFGVEAAAKHYKPGKLLRSAARVVLEKLGLASRLGLTPTSGWVSVDGEALPVVGKIGMEYCMVDVTDSPTVQKGQPVQLAAARCTVNSRITRVYISAQGPRLARLHGQYRQLVGREGGHLRLAPLKTEEVAAAADMD
jgi:alanine racemase